MEGKMVAAQLRRGPRGPRWDRIQPAPLRRRRTPPDLRLGRHGAADRLPRQRPPEGAEGGAVRDLRRGAQAELKLTFSFVRLVLINGMELGDSKRGKVTLVTLGPTGTCHERAAIEYMRFQGVEDFDVEFIGDFFDGLERIRGKENAFLIQCSAHPKVHEVTERYWAEVFVVDTLISFAAAITCFTTGGASGGGLLRRRRGSHRSSPRSAAQGSRRFAARAPRHVRGPRRVARGARARRGGKRRGGRHGGGE